MVSLSLRSQLWKSKKNRISLIQFKLCNFQKKSSSATAGLIPMISVSIVRSGQVKHRSSPNQLIQLVPGPQRDSKRMVFESPEPTLQTIQSCHSNLFQLDLVEKISNSVTRLKKNLNNIAKLFFFNVTQINVNLIY